MMNRFALLLSLALLCGGVGHGQEAPVQTVAEVLRLDAGVVVRTAMPVQLHGVVLRPDPAAHAFHLHDGDASILVIPPAGSILPAMGQAVQVAGQAQTALRGGRMHWQVAAQTVQAGAATPLPAPAPATLSELNTFTRYDQWTRVEGYVLQWRYTAPQLMIRLVTQQDWTTTTIHVPNAAQVPALLHGARLRLTGVNLGDHTRGDALHVPGLEQMEVLEPGTADIFDAPLVGIAAVTRRAVVGGKRLRVRGTLAALMPETRKAVIQGEDGAIMGYLLQPRGPEVPGTLYGDAGQWPDARPGDIVDMVGSVVDQSSVMRVNALSWTSLRVVGKGSVPRPRAMSLEDMLALRQGEHWVTLEATVDAWMLQGRTLTYDVAGANATTVFSVRESLPNVFPRDLYGARIRFTGLATPFSPSPYGCDFVVPGPAFVEIIKPGREDRFAVPELSAADIAGGRFTPAQHVKTTGVVIGQNGGSLYVRGKGSALCVALQSPWLRPASTVGCYFADCGPVPQVRTGDRVELMGMPLRPTGAQPQAFHDLSSTNVRVLGHEDKVVPVGTTLARIAAGAHEADLVQARGRLLLLAQAPAGSGQWRTTLLLEADGRRLPVVHDSPVLDSFDTLKVDDDVIVQAVVDRATPQSPRQLRLLSPGDIHSLGVSPVVQTRRLWLWGGGGAGLFALSLGWIMVLRRSNRLKTETAALLEQKVEERTAELRAAQAGLEKSLEHERELGELKSRFVATVSHEFRTPLGVTMSAVEIIRHFDARLTPERRQELCDEIHDATCGMASLMEQVLLLGRVEAGRMGFQPAPVDIEVLAGKLIDESLSATSRKCPVRWQGGPGLDGARADEALLRHILGNLIANAVKYSTPGGEVIVSARRQGGDLVLAVQDHGIGIPEKDRARLFEAFHRCTNVGDIPGTGLGLVIVKHCVGLHGGRIDVESQAGQGTTFTVRLPVFDTSSHPPET